MLESTNWRPGGGQLGPDQHGQQAADEDEEERDADVLDADHLVVGVELEVVLPAGGAVVGVVISDLAAAAQRNQ